MFRLRKPSEQDVRGFISQQQHSVEGWREITRAVDLETIPLYVRAGAILPLGPVKQYVSEKSNEPLTVAVYPGANGSFLLYEDDGKTFNYRRGEWMGIDMSWNDRERTLNLRLATGSTMLPPTRRDIRFRLNSAERQAEFDGRSLEVRF